MRAQYIGAADEFNPRVVERGIQVARDPLA
jgi:hypothetical protein